MTLEKRPFAGTGKNVSVIGLGTVKFGRNKGVKYPGGDGFALPTDAEIQNLLDIALDSGINLLDTAPAYGTSEERLGKLLGARRDKFFLVTKTGEEFYEDGSSEYIFTADHTRLSIERSLTRLKTDYLDCVLVHANRDDMHVVTDTPVLEVLARFKEEGKIGSFGVSTYTVAAGKKTVDLCDAVMVSYSLGYDDEKEVIDYAAQKGRAVLVKKGLGSGHLADIPVGIRHVASTAGVTSLIIGSLNPANISSNINALLKS